MRIRSSLVAIALLFVVVQLYLHGKYFFLVNRIPTGDLSLTDAGSADESFARGAAAGAAGAGGSAAAGAGAGGAAGGEGRGAAGAVGFGGDGGGAAGATDAADQQQQQQQQALLPDGRVPRLSERTVFGPGTEDRGCIVAPDSGAGGARPAEVVAAVVVVTCCRERYLERTLNALVDVWGQDAANAAKFPLFASQDGNNSQVAETLRSFVPHVRVLQHVEIKEPVRELNAKEILAYYRIANHYKFIFQQFFDCLRYPNLVIIEDDMEVAVDFFSYFEATARLLAADPSLYVVSSWNDHGQERYVRDAYRLYRADFFPGLGWMMPARLWAEFRDKWPHAYWDDWMRLSRIRKGRQSIFPEVCRNYNFGEHGSSKGQYFRQYLKPIKLNAVPVQWPSVDLSYLSQPRYDADLNATLARARSAASVTDAKAAEGDVVLRYNSERQYKVHARSLRMLPDWKDGVPRGGYRGVVIIHYNKARIFLVPSPDFAPDKPGAAGGGGGAGKNRRRLGGRKMGNAAKQQLQQQRRERVNKDLR